MSAQMKTTKMDPIRETAQTTKRTVFDAGGGGISRLKWGDGSSFAKKMI